MRREFMRSKLLRKLDRRRRGASTIFFVIGLSVLIGLAALALDTGIMYAGRGQLQNSMDAAALAAAQAMLAGGSLNRAAGETAAQEVALLHRAVDEPDIHVVTNGGGLGDVVFGNWDEGSGTWTPIPPGGTGDPEDVNAVDVAAVLGEDGNNPVPATLSKVRGIASFDVRASATAYVGYAGQLGPDDPLPIVVDCCAIGACPDSDPDTGYCADGNPPVTNGCNLVRPQTGDPTDNSFSCLEFSPTGTQNACWTQFNNQSSVNSDDLRDLVNLGSYDGITPDPVAGELYNLDNGSKTPVLRAIMRRFEGFPGWTNPDPLTDPTPDEDPVAGEGTDAYEPKDGLIDQWFKILPVFECQNGSDQCATGQNQELLGFVCVEIREVEAPDDHNPDPLNDGDKLVRLNFVCPNNPDIDNCEINGGGVVPGGGANFGLEATIPVLVR